jgi:hypothetical protein
MFDSLLQIVWPVQGRADKLLAWTLSICVWISCAVSKPVCQQIIMEPIWITADAGSCPCYCCTSVKCSHSCIKLPLWKQNKLGTRNLEPYTPVCCARCLRNIRGECAGLALISSTFSSVSSQHLDSVHFLSNHSPVCLNLFMIIWIVFSIWNCNILKCLLESSPYSTYEYCMQTLVSVCNSHMPFWYKK